MASSYLNELTNYYSNLLDLHYNRGHLYQIISTAYIRRVITTASKKIPSSITILPSPLLKTEVNHDNESIHIFGYFPMADVTTFTVIKVTPIPHHHYNPVSMRHDMVYLPSMELATTYHNTTTQAGR
ncbi:hypothetical protein ILUMI_14481 [Ignelater luminosus]|uniref:Uncharacterized protein n=1 Tax=Ignelater luminosus TaxID=2038154 RepID=A0A8K0CUQ3_IGNLU|nr:hypothetical protein ILUMI_14481 [Ignelater luminosus]